MEFLPATPSLKVTYVALVELTPSPSKGVSVHVASFVVLGLYGLQESTVPRGKFV